jgi:hypothetical protein
LFAYIREVAARTEQYWCPIKHARRIVSAHERYHGFADYGDAEAYHGELEALRNELSEEGRPKDPAQELHVPGGQGRVRPSRGLSVFHLRAIAQISSSKWRSAASSYSNLVFSTGSVYPSGTVDSRCVILELPLAVTPASAVEAAT